MMTKDILKRIDELIGLGEEVLAIKLPNSYGALCRVDEGKFRGFRSASLSFLGHIFGSHQIYYAEFFQYVSTSNNLSSTKTGISLLQSAKAEIEGGWLFTVEGQVSAEIFADFIDLAKKALDEKNKDVAAVLICAALEDTLKKYAEQNDIDVDDKDMSQVINALKAGSLLKGLQAKIASGYVTLRNKAFHAEWNKIDEPEVASAIGFTEQFLLTNFS